MLGKTIKNFFGANDFPYELHCKIKDTGQSLKIRVSQQSTNPPNQSHVDQFYTQVLMPLDREKELQKRSLAFQYTIVQEFRRVTGRDLKMDLHVATQMIPPKCLDDVVSLRQWTRVLASEDDIQEIKGYDIPISGTTMQQIITLNWMLEIGYIVGVQHLIKPINSEDPELMECAFQLLHAYSKESEQHYVQAEQVLIAELKVMGNSWLGQYVVAKFINDFIREGTNTADLLMANHIQKYLSPLPIILESIEYPEELTMPLINDRKSKQIHSVGEIELLDELDILKETLNLDLDAEQFSAGVVSDDEQLIQETDNEIRLKSELAIAQQEIQQLQATNAELLQGQSQLQERLSQLIAERVHLMAEIQPGYQQNSLRSTLLGKTKRDPHQQTKSHVVTYQQVGCQTDVVVVDQQQNQQQNVQQNVSQQQPSTQPTKPILPPPPPLPAPPIRVPAVAVNAPAPPIPPPMPGGIRAPPPMPSFGKPAVLKQQQQQQPSIKMKPVGWNKLKSPEMTIWAQLNTNTVKLNQQEIESLFKAKIIQQTQETAKTPVLIKKISKLEAKRQSEVSIVLTKLSKSPNEIAQALTILDLEFLRPEVIDLLLKAIPKQSELSLWVGIQDQDELMQCDIFCITIAKVKAYEERLVSLQLMYEFPKQRDLIADMLFLFDRTFTYIREDKILKIVLQYVLAVGNFMNYNTPKGNAEGIQLDSLLNLDIRSDSEPIDFMMYIVKIVEKDGNIINVDEDLSDLEQLSKEVNKMDNLNVFLNEFKKLFPKIKKAADSQMSELDKAQELFTELYAEIDLFITCQEQLVRAVELQFIETCLYFGENPKNKTTDKLIGVIYEFKKKLKNTKKQMKSIEDKKMRELALQNRKAMIRKKQ